MIGIVIWTNHDSRKAVIWCEDQGSLAYMTEEVDFENRWPQVGDLMRISCETVGPLRYARTAHMIEAGACPQLPAALLGETNRPASNLTVVHSRPDAAPRAMRREPVAALV